MVFNILIITATKKIEEAIACVKKYLRAVSEDNKLFVLFIRGINESKLISSPIQALSHEDDEIVINVPLIRVRKKRILVELLKIKKKRIITFINGV